MRVPQEARKQNKTTFVWERSVVRPAQGSGGDQATNRPMGNLGRTPTTGEKQLRGKMVNIIMAGSIKRPQSCTVNNNNEEQEKTHKNREVGNKEN